MITWRLWIALTSLVSSLCMCQNLTLHAQHGSSNRTVVVDAREWDFSKRLPLKGEWTFVENKVLPPDSPTLRNGRPVLFPSLWNDMRAGGRGTGCATYGLTVIVPYGVNEWVFEIPPLNNSYNLWVNGSLIASAGIVGDKSEQTTPQWIYQLGEYSTNADTLKVVLQVANYHHYKGGATRPLYLGKKEPIEAHFNWAMGSSIAESIILFLSGICFLLYYRSCRKSVIFYFALLCMTWSIRAMFSNVYPLAWMFPDINWEWSVKIEYMTLYLTVVWAALFFHALFDDISNAVFTFLAVGVNVFFITFTLLTPAIIYTRWISIYLAVAALVILYGVAMIVRALIFEKDGSWFLMGSIWIGILLFAYEIAAYHVSFSYNLVLMNIGYLLIFALTTVGLLYHVGIFRTRNLRRDYLTMEDMYRS
jgi:hypothetical protein